MQYQFLAGSLDKPGEPMHPFPGCSLVAIPCRPESRGWLRIRSPDPAVPPAMQPNYLSTRGDRDTMIAGLQDRAPHLPDADDAALVAEEFWPGAAGRQTDEGLLEHVTKTGGTTFHQTSTCMMGPHRPRSSTANCGCTGMEGLRVIDASVMPTVISGNTNAATIMIAEKAADLIRAARRAGGVARSRPAAGLRRTYQMEQSPLAIYQAHLDKGELAYQWSPEAGRAVFYPRLVCPYSGSTTLEWRVASGLGTVYATTVTHPAQGDAYNVALIDCDEGFRLMSRVEDIDPMAVRIGMRVRFRVHPAGAATSRPIPVFTPAEGTP